jgi:hypothetical protein
MDIQALPAQMMRGASHRVGVVSTERKAGHQGREWVGSDRAKDWL